MLLATTPTPKPAATVTTGTPAWALVAVAVVTALATLAAAIWTQWQQAKAETARAAAAANREDRRAHQAERRDLYVRVLAAIKQTEVAARRVRDAKGVTAATQSEREFEQEEAKLNTVLAEVLLLCDQAVGKATRRVRDAVSKGRLKSGGEDLAQEKKAAKAALLKTMRADLDSLREASSKPTSPIAPESSRGSMAG